MANLIMHSALFSWFIDHTSSVPALSWSGSQWIHAQTLTLIHISRRSWHLNLERIGNPHRRGDEHAELHKDSNLSSAACEAPSLPAVPLCLPVQLANLCRPTSSATAADKRKWELFLTQKDKKKKVKRCKLQHVKVVKKKKSSNLYCN